MSGRTPASMPRVHHRLLILIASLGLLVAPAAANAGAGSWLAAGQLSEKRGGAMAARLGDNTVIVAGGINGGEAFTSVDRYDPGSNSWSAAAPMATPRAHAAAISLEDGRVLVAGGRVRVHDATNTAEVFDPRTGAWSPAGTMAVARGYHGGVRLADGRVLVVGGDGISDRAVGAEIWNPKTNAWTPTGPMIAPRFEPVIALLADGSVFVAGGWNGDRLATAELYHPDTDTWTETTPMTEPRTGPGVAGLPDGRVLVAGGHGWVDGHPWVSQSSEIYDPCSGAWTPAAGLNTPRGEGLQMNTLVDGRPVISGGFWWTNVYRGPDGRWDWNTDRYENSAEVYDPVTGVWTQSPAAAAGRAAHVAVPLADNSLLVAGGYFTALEAERYLPGAPAVAAAPTPAGVARAAATRTIQSGAPRPVLANYLSGLPRQLKVSRTGKIKLRVRCSGPGSCVDQLVLRLRGGAVLGTAKLAIQHGRSATVTLTLKPSALRKLKTTKRTKVTLELKTRRLSLDATAQRERAKKTKVRAKR